MCSVVLELRFQKPCICSVSSLLVDEERVLEKEQKARGRRKDQFLLGCFLSACFCKHYSNNGSSKGSSPFFQEIPNPVHGFFPHVQTQPHLTCSETPILEAHVAFLNVWPGYQTIWFSPPRSETLTPLARIFSSGVGILALWGPLSKFLNLNKSKIFLSLLGLGMVGVSVQG